MVSRMRDLEKPVLQGICELIYRHSKYQKMYTNRIFETKKSINFVKNLNKDKSQKFLKYTQNYIISLNTLKIHCIQTNKILKIFLPNISWNSYTKNCENETKNPANGRQSISRPMRTVAPIPQ